MCVDSAEEPVPSVRKNLQKERKESLPGVLVSGDDGYGNPFSTE